MPTLTISNIQVYSANNTWEELTDKVLANGHGAQNAGIKSLTYKTLTIAGNAPIIGMWIDAELVNQVPYASDNASLMFCIGGSNYHIDIQKDGNMRKTGIYGPTPNAVDWDGFLDKVGGSSSFLVSSQS